MKEAVANQYSGTVNAVNSGDSWTAYQDLTITADPSPGDAYGTAGSNASNTGVDNCSDVQAAITTLHEFINEALNNASLLDLPAESVSYTHLTLPTKA